jgi:hypothetical protein
VDVRACRHILTRHTQARLMAASKQGILCDELTFQNAQRTIEFHALDAIKVRLVDVCDRACCVIVRAV